VPLFSKLSENEFNNLLQARIVNPDEGFYYPEKVSILQNYYTKICLA